MLLLALAAFAVVAYGALVAKRAWAFSGPILGQLGVSQPLFSGEKNVYALKVASTGVGRISELDSWYIDGPYAYGTMLPQARGGDAFFLFDCKAQRFEVFTDQAGFGAAVSRRGLAQKSAMGGENVVRLKYNRRLFSPDCAGGTG